MREKASNSSFEFPANTKVKTGEVFYDLLKIHQKVKGCLVDGEVFILRQKQALKKCREQGDISPCTPSL